MGLKDKSEKQKKKKISKEPRGQDHDPLLGLKLSCSHRASTWQANITRCK